MATKEELSNQLTAPASSQEKRPLTNPDAVSFQSVLNAELDQIEISRRYRDVSQPVPPHTPDDESFPRADLSRLAGLAFSGGGIRSATFNLGILQGLAEARALRRFDYLSTVSGGGYIGCWLAGCVKRLQTNENNQPKVERVLLPSGTRASTGNEPASVSFLRDYSNYLTPRVGLLGGDTWAFITTYVRNLFLNLLILVSALTSILLLPYILDFITRSIRGKLLRHNGNQWLPNSSTARGDHALIALALVFLVVAVTFIIRNVTVLSDPKRSSARFTGEKAVQLTIVLPLFLTAWLYSAWIYAFASIHSDLIGLNAGFWVQAAAMVGVGVWGIGSVLTWWSSDEGALRQEWAPTLVWQFVAILASSVTAGLLLWKLEALAIFFIHKPPLEHPTWSIVGWLPPLLIGVIIVVFFLQIGITGRRTSEDAREWFSRLCGYLIISVLTWSALFLVASPMLADRFHGWTRNLSGIVVWLGSTGAGLLMAQKKDSDTTNGSKAALRKLVATVAPYLFVVGLLVLLSVIINLVHLRIDKTWRPSVYDIYVCLGCALLSVVLSSRVDVNLFSMHALYSNRLVRCYLGASRSKRQPQPFTGFDPDDNLSLAALAPSAGYEGPYPIVNTALNLVHGKELAWQQRKAESFVFTPLYCGFSNRHNGQQAKNPRLSPEAYRPTSQYGYTGGPYMGTAVSISGAAASPNMGYHSSPAVGFLLTIFNVRLGWWMGNPRHEGTWRLSAPRLGLIYLLNELLGRTDDTSAFVYLSDGGHFENLGIYELVRRRCSMIMVCDAAQDGDFRFEDLAGAIEKCRTDFSVEIDLGSVEEIGPQKDSIYSKSHYAFGTIRYDAHHTGVIIYVKSSLTGKESVELASYQSAHPTYPHESTADQWFTEAQFESYRQLGYRIAKGLAQDDRFIEALKMTRGVEAVSARAPQQAAGA